jgi:uncharacterized BrkB/YihY/UPF0761 family membrane protein
MTTPPRRPLLMLMLSWTALCRRVWRHLDGLGMRIYASSIAYRAIFSTVAFLSTIVLIARLLDVQLSKARSSVLFDALSPEMRDTVIRRAEHTINGPFGDVLTAGIVGFLIGLYGMAGGFAAICDALNRIFDSYRYTKVTRRYLRGALVAFMFIILFGSAALLGAITSSGGQALLDALGLQVLAGVAAATISAAVAIVLVLIGFALLLRYGSFARPPWLHVLASAVVGGGLLILMTIGMGAYVQLIGPFAEYGALAGAVGILLYGYLSAYLLLLVAVFSPTLGSGLEFLLGRGPLRFELAGDTSDASDLLRT